MCERRAEKRNKQRGGLSSPLCLHAFARRMVCTQHLSPFSGSPSLPPVFSFIYSIATAHYSFCWSLVGRRASSGHGARRGEFLEDGEGSAATQPGARVWSPSPRRRRCTTFLLPVLPLSSLNLLLRGFSLIPLPVVFYLASPNPIPRGRRPHARPPRALPLPATFSASQDSQLARSPPSTCRVFKCLSAQLL